MAEYATVNRQHKDRLFRKLFDDEKELLSLYNAMNGTDYDNPEDLTITTLENVIYMKVKNDISFAIEGTMNLYEHQSSFNPNMPLRGLFYLSDLLRGYVSRESLDLYASKPVTIPFPKYVIFYNGDREMPDLLELHLKDLFFPQGKEGENPALDVTCVMVNINYGHNKVLMERCPLLEQYSRFISTIKEYIQQKLSLAEAVRKAIDFCIESSVLADFLRQHREEAFHMILEEYNEELHKKNEEEYWTSIGRKEGLETAKKIIQMSAQGIEPEEIAQKLDLSISEIEHLLK